LLSEGLNHRRFLNSGKHEPPFAKVLDGRAKVVELSVIDDDEAVMKCLGTPN
jgi:hypothetical protein